MVRHLAGLLLIAVVFSLIAIRVSSSATERKWPTPPAWWLNSRDMVAVRIAESGNGSGSTNLYGITAPAWRQAQLIGVRTESSSAWTASRAEQHYVAFRLWQYYHRRTGDGCHAVWGVWDGAC